jgi:hypothetical protein
VHQCHWAAAAQNCRHWSLIEQLRSFVYELKSFVGKFSAGETYKLESNFSLLSIVSFQMIPEFKDFKTAP